MILFEIAFYGGNCVIGTERVLPLNPSLAESSFAFRIINEVSKKECRDEKHDPQDKGESRVSRTGYPECEQEQCQEQEYAEDNKCLRSPGWIWELIPAVQILTDARSVIHGST